MVEQNGAELEGYENILVKTIDDVINNRKGADVLSSVLKESSDYLSKIRSDFFMNLSAQPEEVQKACRDVVRVISKLFDDYDTVLTDVSSFNFNFDRSALAESMEKISTISQKLDRAFFEFRQIGLTAMGPTKVPGLNLLIYTLDETAAGRLGVELLKEEVEREATIAEIRLEELSQGRDPDSHAMSNAYGQYLDIIDKFCEGEEAGEPDFLEKFRVNILNIGEIFRESDSFLRAESLCVGETASPLANVIINSSRLLREGALNEEEFSAYLQDFWEQIESIKFAQNAIFRNQPSSTTVEEEAERVSESLIFVEEVINYYYEILEGGDYSLFDEANSKLTGIVKEFEESNHIFNEMIKNEGKVPCPRCGHYNNPGSRVCDSCNAMMPAVTVEHTSNIDFMEGGSSDGQPGSDDVKMTANVEKLFVDAKDLAEGTIGTSQFVETLEWIEELLEKAYESSVPPTDVKTPQDPKEKKLAKAIDETSVVYNEGLEDFEVGLNFMRQFGENRSPQSLQAGMSMIWQALGKLQKVQRVMEPLAKKK